MNFKREEIQNYYLHNTQVENVFINEYMIDAPGDYVKIYLFALMYAGISATMDNEFIAKQFSIPDEDVLKAWTYWERKGIIRKHYKDPEDRFHYEVEFINLKEQIYGNSDKNKTKDEELSGNLKALMDDKELRKMYSRIQQITGNLFEGKEPVIILDWIKDYNISPEVVIYAYEYCVNKRNNKKCNYVGAIVKEWATKGLDTIPKIEKHLQENDNRYYLYKRVLRALGLLRNPTEEERRIMDTWFNEMDYDIAQVLEACKKTSGISNPNINYINAILKAWKNGDKKENKKEATPKDSSISLVLKSYEEDKAKNEAEVEARRIEVYKVVPRIKEIEKEMGEISMMISKEMLSGQPGSKQKIKKYRAKTDKLNHERAYLLTDNNFQLNYMETWYTCSLCKDTGLLDTGERCTCFAEKLSKIGKKV